MKNKHTGKIVVLLILMFLSTYGTIAGYLFEQGADYGRGMGYGLLLSLVSIVLISAIMMFVPCIGRLANNDKLPYKQGKRLCLWNSVVLFIISSALLALGKANFIGGIGAIIYYYINKWLFVKPAYETKISNHLTKQTPVGIESVPELYNQTTPISNALKKYCSKCGKVIEPVTKKCTGCGKQYFTVFSFKQLLVSILCVLFVLSFSGNIILYLANVSLREEYDESKTANSSRITELKDEILDLQKENNNLQRQIIINEEKINFMNDYIVVIEDDGTNLYHTYDCSKFLGNSFWAFNTDAAKSEGYAPCPLCCD